MNIVSIFTAHNIALILVLAGIAVFFHVVLNRAEKHEARGRKRKSAVAK